MTEKLVLKVTLGSEEIHLTMQMITLKQENALRAGFAGIKESEKELKEFALNVDALAEFHVKDVYPMALQDVEVKGNENQEQGTPPQTERKLIKLQGSTPGAAIKTYFANKTAVTERMAEYAVRSYLFKLQPEVSFL